MNLPDLNSLHGRVVLVESALDHHNPPTGVRGSIEVTEDPRGTLGPKVQIALDFPQMFLTPAHHRTIPLSAADLEQLLASERNGSFEFVINGPLDPAAADVIH
jgi:hypothetical protein